MKFGSDKVKITANGWKSPKTDEIRRKRAEIIINKVKIHKNAWKSRKTNKNPQKQMKCTPNTKKLRVSS